MYAQPFCHSYKPYGWTKYNQGRHNKPVPRENKCKEASRYWDTKQRIQDLIAHLPGFTIMNNPTDDDTRSEFNDSSAVGDMDELIHRTNPTCKSLQKDLEKIHSLLGKLRSDVTTGLDELTEILTKDIEGVLPRLHALETTQNSHDSRLQVLEDRLAKVLSSDNVTIQASPKLEAAQDDLRVRLETAAVVIATLEKQIQSSNSCILYNTQLHNVNKYRISGIPFVEGEDPVVETTTFLRNIMSVQVNDGDIVMASRMPGTITVRIKGNLVKLPPQMFVQVTCHLQKRIAANMSELDDKTDPTDGHFYKVKQQVPNAVQGARQHFNPVVADVQQKNKGRSKKERIPFYFQGTDLFVGGKKVKQLVNPPSHAEILNITSEEQKQLNDINPPILARDEKDGSKFYAFAMRVYDVRFVRKAYLRLRQLHLAANHVMLAFRVEDPANPD